MLSNKGNDIPSYNEEKIKSLSNQVIQLQTQILHLKSQLSEKSNLINQLQNQNLKLKSRFNLQQNEQGASQININHNNPSSLDNYEIKPDISSSQNVPNQIKNDKNYTLNKRECPICGAMGFAIKEFDDKTKIISYIPRRIYAKKRVCTKCRTEF